MASRLITPVLEERLKSYPLYSQDGKGKDAVCVAIFFIGHVRFAIVARITLKATLSTNIVVKDEPVFFAIAHSTRRLCDTKRINDRMVACLIVKSIVAIKAIGA